MIRHFFIAAIRNLVRSKTFTSINLIGLSLSIAAFLALLSFVFWEFSYDNFLTSRDKIYRIEYSEFQGTEPVLQTARTHSRAAFLIREYLPQVENVARIYQERALVFNEQTRITDQKVIFADSTFFHVFDFPLVSGSPDKSLEAPNSMMISETQSKNYFGDQDPIGKTLYFNEHLPFTITGVFRDVPPNSSLQFDFLLSWSTMTSYGWITREGDFHFPWLFTFIRVNQAIEDTKTLENSLQKMADDHVVSLRDRKHSGKYSIRPYRDMHMATALSGEMVPGTSKTLLFGLLSLAIFILVTAWINYINLSVAKAIGRANEIGVRKVFGASRLMISWQFVMEALILSTLTCVAGVLLYNLIVYNLGLHFSSLTNQNSIFWILVILSIVIGTLLASAYPAYFMSRYKPALILRNKLGSGKSRLSFLHRGLLLFQVFLAVCIIGISAITTKQIHYIRNFDAGFNSANTISLRGPASTNSDSIRQQRYFAFREEILSHPQFSAATSSMNIPGEELRFHDEGIVAVGASNEKKQPFWIGWIDDGYIQTFGLQLISGRNFHREEPANSCLINETGAIALGYSNVNDVVGTSFIDSENNKKTVVGVIKDFHHESLRKTVEPLLLYPRHPHEFGYYTIRTQSRESTIPLINEVWRKHYPNDPFVYYFMDSFFARQYEQDEFFNKLLHFFSVVSIAVASLGLFGMASLTMVRRLKEIGIRKVLGASIPGLLVMLSSEYLIIIIGAIMLALPVSIHVTTLWLENFSYKVAHSWATWLVPGCIAVVLTLLTVGFQSLRAALTNPSDVLKSE